VSGGHVDAEFYAQVKSEYWGYNRDRVRGAKVVALTQKKPAEPRGGTVVVKLTIRIPEAAFLPLRPEAVIVIPEDMTAPYPIQVEAGDPS
jgi:hypothetical protein